MKMYKKKCSKQNKISLVMKNFLSLILVFVLSGCSNDNTKSDIAPLYDRFKSLRADSKAESRTEDSDGTEDESSTDVSDKAEAENEIDVSDEAGNEDENDYQSLGGRWGIQGPNFGFIKENSYANPILGLGCTFDENWILYSYDEMMNKRREE